MTQSLTTRPPAPPAHPQDRSPRLPGLARLRSLGRLPRWASPLPSWGPPALGVLLGLAGGAAYGLFAAPQYTATGYVAVVPGAGTDSATALGFAQAYGRIATDTAVLVEARGATGATVDDLRDDVRAATSPDAPMVEVTGTASSPGKAADVANAVADALVRVGNRTVTSTGVQLSLFSPALAPTEPTSPSLPLAAAVGACAGGLTGGLVLLASPRGRREDPAFPGVVPAPAGSTEGTGSGGGSGEAEPDPVPAGPAARTTAADRRRDDRHRGDRRPPR